MKALNDASQDTTMVSDMTQTTSATSPEQRRGLPKVRSGLNLAQNYVEVSDGKIGQKEVMIKQELDSKKGFDLS